MLGKLEDIEMVLETMAWVNSYNLMLRRGLSTCLAYYNCVRTL